MWLVGWDYFVKCKQYYSSNKNKNKNKNKNNNKNTHHSFQYYEQKHIDSIILVYYRMFHL